MFRNVSNDQLFKNLDVNWALVSQFSNLSPFFAQNKCCLFLFSVTDICLPNPCQNGGQCTVLANSNIQCVCQGGFTGDICDQGERSVVT